MSDTYDLDALAPKSVTIHLNGEDIQVRPPSTAVMLRMGQLKGLQNADKLSAEELDKLAVVVNEIIVAAIPELEGKDLGAAQQFKLLEIIGDLTTPPDVKELQKRGITTATGGDGSKKDQPA